MPAGFRRWSPPASSPAACLTPTPCLTTSFPALPLPPAAEGVKAEEAFEKDGSKPDPASTDNPEFQIVLRIIRDGLESSPKK